MELAISIGIGNQRPVLNLALIQRAEALGYGSVWTAETWGADALSPLAYLAGQTTRMKLGSGIAQIDARSAAMMAQTAQTIDALAGGGRMVLGIGTSGPQVVEGWHGRPWGKPNFRLRDTVAIIRKVWSGDYVSHDGKELQLPYVGPGSVGLGKPLKNAFKPEAPIPILIGAETPLNVRMTGEIADGLVAMHTVPKQVKDLQALLSEGLAKRADGKTLAEFQIVSGVRVALTDDVRGAIEKAKKGIALYTGGFGARDLNFHKNGMIKRGYAEAADRIQELFLAGHREEAAKAVPDEYVEEEVLIGPEARIRERFAAWRDSGFTTLHIHTERPEVLELIARANDA
jgi:F420-dependent oxidoreductase-like protein